jgi:CBS domain-containing protein
MSTVAQIIEYKGTVVHATSAQRSVSEALAEMAEHEVEGLVVMEDGALTGIFTSNDYLRKIVGAGLDVAGLRVGDVMTRNVKSVGPGAEVSDCVAMMSRGRFRHLPVIDGQRLVGIVTMVDIMRFNAERAIERGDGEPPAE